MFEIEKKIEELRGRKLEKKIGDIINVWWKETKIFLIKIWGKEFEKLD